MPETETQIDPGERLGKKAVDRITELERVVKALVHAIKTAEETWEEPLMPIGTYYGHKFES